MCADGPRRAVGRVVTVAVFRADDHNGTVPQLVDGFGPAVGA